MAETSSSRRDLTASLSRFAKLLHKLILKLMNVKISRAPTCEPIGEITIFPIVVFAAIMIADVNLSPALAAAEETAGAGDSVSDYNQSSFLFDLTDDFTLNEIPGSDVNIGDVFIPTTVWNLELEHRPFRSHP